MTWAVFSLSKIKNLKAIHNRIGFLVHAVKAVFSLSKIKNLKAIHNKLLYNYTIFVYSQNETDNCI